MKRIHFLLPFVVAVAWFGCSSERDEFGGDSNLFAVPDAGGDACTGELSCSRDSRQVIDCSGKVIETCSEDKACGNGQCLDLCSAAATNEGSVGCSFAVPPPFDDTPGTRGGCYALFVANNAPLPANLHIEAGGVQGELESTVWIPSVVNGTVTHTKLEGPIPPGTGAVVFLSNKSEKTEPYQTLCPVGTKSVFDDEGTIVGTGIGHATLVTSDVPVSMYAMYPYGGAGAWIPSAMLLLPTASYSTNYILATSWGSNSDRFGTDTLRSANTVPTTPRDPGIQIVAVEDDTSIDVRPRVDIIGTQDVAAGARDEVVTYRLDRGGVLQILQHNDLVGSVIESNKPVGVFGGHNGMYVPVDVAFADLDQTQIPPVSAWGHEYAILPAPNRVDLFSRGTEKAPDPSPVRLVGAVSGTELTYEPMRPQGAPDHLDSGELAVFFANDPFVVRSQDVEHPFFAMVLMTGAGATSYDKGDPESVLALATDQWLSNYLFFSDSSYDSSSVYVTRRKFEGAFHDVTLDCAGPLEGWRRITDDYEWTYVELSWFGDPVPYAGGTCADGTHRISSDAPFGTTVWGLAMDASYGYPGGASLARHTPVQVSVH